MSDTKTIGDLVNGLISDYEGLGGAEGMLEWAQESDENRRAFYKIVMKKVPDHVRKDIERFLSEGEPVKT